MADFKFRYYTRGDLIGETTYSYLLKSMELEKEAYLGEPLIFGTEKTARYVAVLFKTKFPDVKKIEIAELDGTKVGVFGIITDLEKYL